MKALEQAAKDRGETKTERTAPPAGKPELSLALELLAPDASARTRPDAPKARAAEAGASPGADDQARAATIARAGPRATDSRDHFRRVNPVILVGAVAGLVAIGFAIYVYLQIYHPGWFVRRAPPAPPAAPIAQAHEPAPPATPSSAPIPASVVLPPVTDTREAPAVATIVPPPLKPAAPVSEPRAASPPANRIVISRGAPAPTVNPALTEAYTALQSGNMESAQRLYAQIARAEPRNIDALLGLAATAAAQGRADDAARHYLQILDLDPRHAVAQSGLIGVYGRGDPLGAETRLKQLIARDPSAFLYFTLGNLYADQSLWAQAQQAYFQAYHLEPGNPDYAYNLAVGLEHLGQPKLALGFYRQATALATNRGYANFSRTQAEERIKRLGAQVE